MDRVDRRLARGRLKQGDDKRSSPMALDLAAVASGAAIGGALRHAIASSPRISARPNGRLWAIGAINVAGSALLAGVACCAPLQ
eukprot:COSAG04_NODE_16980_length_483_cov_0.940104_1_plen_83_part_10